MKRPPSVGGRGAIFALLSRAAERIRNRRVRDTAGTGGRLHSSGRTSRNSVAWEVSPRCGPRNRWHGGRVRRDSSQSRKFAIKVLHPHLSSRSEFRERFLREGYAANRVPHDDVVSVWTTTSTKPAQPSWSWNTCTGTISKHWSAVRGEAADSDSAVHRGRAPRNTRSGALEWYRPLRYQAGKRVRVADRALETARLWHCITARLQRIRDTQPQHFRHSSVHVARASRHKDGDNRRTFRPVVARRDTVRAAHGSIAHEAPSADKILRRAAERPRSLACNGCTRDAALGGCSRVESARSRNRRGGLRRP